MTWETFYLVCFVLGLALSVLSLLGGMGHFGGHLHFPHATHLPHVPHVGHVPHSGAIKLGSARGGATIAWWNAFSIMIFLCWFGAAGYLLTRHGASVASLVLLIAIACGLAGGAIVFLFLTRVMLPHEHDLTAEETAIVGAIGTVSSAIRAGGTGEMVYEQLGARRAVPVRAEDGGDIARQEEVFVVRYEKGVAYVRRWGDVEIDQSDREQTRKA